MEEGAARALGFKPLAFVKSWGFAAVDPNWQLLAAPAIAIPRALRAAGTTLNDIDIVDMHEAFAAQVLSNLQALGSAQWQQEHAGFEHAAGTVPLDRLNIYGGSIALGHPFAATGARQALTMAHELSRRGQGKALISQCTAGGLGAALILEAAQS
jgi:acetyl-CoA acyltransferase